MKSPTFFSILLQFLLINLLNHAFEIEGIYNGVLADHFNYRYQAAFIGLRNFSNTFEPVGSGALIARRFVLSAAHLFVNERNELRPLTFFVRLATANWRNNVFDTRIAFVFYFLEYSLYAVGNDLVVVEISDSNVPDHNAKWKIVPIASSNWVSFNIAEGVVSGYGVHSTIENMDCSLRDAIAKIVVKSDCSNIVINSLQICVKINADQMNGPRGLCTYDGGTPLVINNHLVAIASFPSEDCNDSVTGVIFTDVRPLDTYIQAITLGFTALTKKLINRQHIAPE